MAPGNPGRYRSVTDLGGTPYAEITLCCCLSCRAAEPWMGRHPCRRRISCRCRYRLDPCRGPNRTCFYLALANRGAYQPCKLPRQVGGAVLLPQGWHQRLHGRGAQLSAGRGKIRKDACRDCRRERRLCRQSQIILCQGRLELSPAERHRQKGRGAIWFAG